MLALCKCRLIHSLLEVTLVCASLKAQRLSIEEHILRQRSVLRATLRCGFERLFDEECVIASLNYLPILSLTSSSHCVSDMTELVHLHELFISPGRLALGLRYVLMSTTEHTSITMHLQVAMYLQSTMHFQFHGHLGYARCLMRIVMRQFYSTFTLRPSTRMNPTSDTNFVSPSL
jgi:hypothetical protein